MKKVLVVLLILILGFSILTGCKKENIKIGYAGCLTGTNSELGVSGMYGAMMEVDDLNQSGGIDGRKVELVIKDDQGDKDIALRVDKELVQEGCIAIIGHMTSDMAELTVPYANENKILMISPTIALPSLAGVDDYFFRLIPTTTDQAERIAKELITRNIKKVQIAYSDQNKVFASCISQSLIINLEKNRIQTELVGSIKAKKHNPEYEKTAQKIGSSDADALVLVASADVTSEIAQSLYQEGSKTKVFLPAWAMTNDLINRGGPAVEGYYGVNFMDYNSESKGFLEFRSKYVQKYGDEPTFASVLSYESVSVLISAMKESNGFDSDDLKAAIIKKKDFQGLQGNLEIDQYGDIERDIYLYQIRNGKFLRVD